MRSTRQHAFYLFVLLLSVTSLLAANISHAQDYVSYILLAVARSGNQIAFVQQKGQLQELFVAAIDGTNSHSLIKVGERDPHIRAIAWSPDEQRIAFFTSEAIFVIEVASSTQKIVSGANCLMWTPDSKSLLLAAQDGIYAVDVDSGQRTQLVAALGTSCPSISADGLTLTFIASTQDTPLSVNVFDIATKKVQVVAKNIPKNSQIGNVQLTPNHNTIVYRKHDPNIAGDVICVIPTEGGAERCFRGADPLLTFDYAQLSANGKQFLTVGTNPDPPRKGHIFLVDVDTLQGREVIVFPGRVEAASLLPDTQTIVFAGTRDLRGDIYFINADGSNLRKLGEANSANNTAPILDGTLELTDSQTSTKVSVQFPKAWKGYNDGGAVLLGPTVDTLNDKLLSGDVLINVAVGKYAINTTYLLTQGVLSTSPRDVLQSVTVRLRSANAGSIIEKTLGGKPAAVQEFLNVTNRDYYFIAFSVNGFPIVFSARTLPGEGKNFQGLLEAMAASAGVNAPSIPVTVPTLPPTLSPIPTIAAPTLPTATRLPSATPTVRSTFAPSAGDKFAYIKNDLVYIASTNGTGSHVLSDQLQGAIFVSWSPDGNRLAVGVDNRQCTTTSACLHGIYTIWADGTNLTALSESAKDGYPQWSPDGSTILFTRGVENFLEFDRDTLQKAELWTMTDTGENKTKLSGPGDAYGAFSPDGKRIAFVSLRNKIFNISAMNADGSNPVALTRDNQFSVFNFYPKWSPDGKQIAFQHNGGFRFEIIKMNADGSGSVSITDPQKQSLYPAWSPDGKQLLYEFYQLPTLTIHVINSDGTGDKELLQGTRPVWQPRTTTQLQTSSTNAPAASPTTAVIPTISSATLMPGKLVSGSVPAKGRTDFILSGRANETYEITVSKLNKFDFKLEVSVVGGLGLSLSTLTKTGEGVYQVKLPSDSNFLVSVIETSGANGLFNIVANALTTSVSVPTASPTPQPIVSPVPQSITPGQAINSTVPEGGTADFKLDGGTGETYEIDVSNASFTSTQFEVQVFPPVGGALPLTPKGNGLYSVTLPSPGIYTIRITEKSGKGGSFRIQVNAVKAVSQATATVTTLSPTLTVAPTATTALTAVAQNGDLITRGNALLKTRDFAGALAAFQQALQQKPNDPPALLGLGKAYSGQKQFADARKAFEQYLVANGGKASNRLEAVQILYAIEYNEGLITKDCDPNESAINLSNFGVSFFATGEMNKAIPPLICAALADPAFGTAYQNLISAYGNYANTFAKSDLDKVVRYYERAYLIDPTSSFAITGLSSALSNRGLGRKWFNDQKVDATLAKLSELDYLRAIAVKPDNAAPYLNVATLYFNTGRNREALDYYRKFVSMGGLSTVNSDIQERVKNSIKFLEDKERAGTLDATPAATIPPPPVPNPSATPGTGKTAVAQSPGATPGTGGNTPITAVTITLPSSEDQVIATDTIWILFGGQPAISKPGKLALVSPPFVAKPLMLRYRWCANTEANRTAILAPFSIKFYVDDVEIDPANILVFDRLTQQKEYCRFYATLLSDWPKGKNVVLKIVFTLTAAVNDGKTNFPAGTYETNVTMRVKSDNGAVAPVVAPTATPRPTQGATPITPMASCPGSPKPRLVIGEKGVVTPGDPNNLNTKPSRPSKDPTSKKLGSIPPGGVFTVLEGPVCNQGIIWWKVDYNGLIGWTGEGDTKYWTEPVGKGN